ncbi:MAG: hypothetical protein GXP62_07845 [Oligoflexia bacterium]|nr:hypothetical protein [Oligoflexia bacterium]
MSLGSFTWVLGFVLIFVGERMFGGGTESWRYILDGTGLVSVLVTLGLLFAARSKAPRHQQGSYGLGLIFSGVGLLSLVLYGLSTDPVLNALSLESDAADHWSVAMLALAPIAWLAGTLPLLSIQRALALSPVQSIPKLVREGAMSALAVSFALSMLVPLNYLASQTNKRWDLGYFKTAQAGSRTQAMVDSLEEPLRVVAFFPTASDVGAEVKSYFDGISGDKLQVEYVDHALEPGLAKELKVRDNGYVAFVRGDQIERVKIGDDFESARRKLKDLDQELQKSLAKLARGPHIAYFTVGHGELYWRASEKDRKLNTLKQLLTGLNYKVKELGLANGLGSAVPDDADVVFVMGPTKPFLDEEIASLNRYRVGGGALFIGLDPGGSDLSGLLKPMGLSADMAHPLVIDNYFLKVTGGPGDQLNLVTNKFSSHPSVTTLSRNSQQVAMAFPGAVAIEQDKNPPDKVQTTIRSLPVAWQDLNGDLKFQAATEKRKQWTLGVAVSGPSNHTAAPVLPAADEKGPKPHKPKVAPSDEYRVVVIGDAGWASDLFVPYSGNGQLALDALSWLTEDDALKGETSSEEDVKIQHTKEGQGLWFYGSAVFLPLGLLALGIGRLSLRRRRARRN